MVEEWSGVIEGEITGDQVQFDLAFSNIDDSAPDGLAGPTTVEVVVSID